MIKIKSGTLYQWDQNRALEIDDPENKIYEVECCRDNDEKSVIIPFFRNGDKIEAVLPNLFLQSSQNVHVFAVSKENNEVRTSEHKVYSVVPRVRPSDYVYEENEVLKYKELAEELKMALGNKADLDENGKINLEQLPNNSVSDETLTKAINTALMQAKESGEFDGKDGVDGTNGIDGKDGYTPVKGVDYFDGAKGDKGDKGDQGIQGIQGIPGEKGEKGDTGSQGIQGEPGADGKNGTNGTSVTVKSVSESSADGGSNVVTFSDGKTITIKNGSKGSTGEKGEKGADGNDYILTSADKVEIAEIVSSGNIPDYWNTELKTKANTIQAAMEKAGKNKSAFLWYTDAHWANGSSKVSPKLLNYLYVNTPMNKVNFGGDIIGDTLLSSREQMTYLYEWRKAIKNLPNHHSILGNHDMFNSDNVDYEDDNYRYAFMLASEETSDMVMGDGNYYYIDNPCEKTRYIHLCYMTSDHAAMMSQGQFIVDAITSVSEGWHIVVIAHRWWQYTSSSAPTVGSVPNYEKEILKILDEYNARTTHTASNYFNSQNFANAKGKVEFCIGGHIHVDYDFETDGGIPVINTTSDANQNRVPDSTVDSGTTGTTTESAVFGIIADYNNADNTKITVVGVGRGTSRVVRKSAVKPTSISDISYSGDKIEGSTIDKSKFTFTVNYSNGTTDTVTGATSVSPTTISRGDNSVTIIYTEGSTTLTGTITIVGEVNNLLKLNRTYVAGTTDAYIYNNFDESKAYTNVAYTDGKFYSKACTTSNITETGITVKEPGIGGICVAYPVNLPNLASKSYKLSFDYAGSGSYKARVYWRGVYANGQGLATTNPICDKTGSGNIDFTIPSTNSYNKIVVFFGSNTSGTATFSNVSLVEM